MYLYIIGNNMRLFTKKHNEIRFIKVGISQDPEKRLKQLQTGCPFPLAIIKLFKHDDARYLEQELHKDLERYNTSGEWFMIPQSGLTSTIKHLSKLVDSKKPNIKISSADRYKTHLSKLKKRGLLTTDTLWSYVNAPFKDLEQQTRLEIALDILS